MWFGGIWFLLSVTKMCCSVCLGKNCRGCIIWLTASGHLSRGVMVPCSRAGTLSRKARALLLLSQTSEIPGVWTCPTPPLHSNRNLKTSWNQHNGVLLRQNWQCFGYTCENTYQLWARKVIGKWEKSSLLGVMWSLAVKDVESNVSVVSK